MAKKRSDYKPEDIMFPDQIITSSELVHEMKTSYIEYAMSVIVGRALPDVRDGLKPVHRRILYAMYEDGLTRDKPYRKCATAVGDVLGRYHPHGDASVYDALVRLAQDFSMRYPLIVYRYEQRDKAVSGGSVLSAKSQAVMREGIMNVRVAQNIVVVKCYTGMAQAVCASIDALDRTNIVGSLAGDDTIFLVATDNDRALDIVSEINAITAG